MNSTRSTINSSCGLNPNASVKWKKYFYDVHLGLNHYTIRCFFSELFPSGMIILFNSYIIYHLIRTSHHLTQTNENQISKEQRRTTSWMNIVLILHSFLFLSSLLSHIVGHFMSVEAHETWWVLLTVLGSCSLNFYVYCLSGKAFRQKIIRFIQRLTTKSFRKLQIRKRRWEQHQQSPKDERFIYKNDPLVRNDQPGTYHSKCSQRSIRINSSSRISEEESPL
jgi:magnesium-transporting ATPase (P-type)